MAGRGRPRQRLFRVSRLGVQRSPQFGDGRRRRRSRRRRHAELGEVFGVRAREPRLPAALRRLRQGDHVRDVAPPVEHVRHVVHGGRAELRRRRHRPPSPVRLGALHDGAAQRRKLDVDDRGLRAGLDRRRVAPVAHDSLERVHVFVAVAALALGARQVHAREGHGARRAGAVNDARRQSQRAVRPARPPAAFFRGGVHLRRRGRALVANRVHYARRVARGFYLDASRTDELALLHPHLRVVVQQVEALAEIKLDGGDAEGERGDALGVVPFSSRQRR